MELTENGRVLVATLLFRLLFGGYLIGLDQFHFNDVESALTVLLIYGLVGIFAVLFLLGKIRTIRNNRSGYCFHYTAMCFHNCCVGSNSRCRFA
jgi:hypothetical protein